ncbi:hypothetical protein AVEN_103096-1, partial [Araneus ventricosus]
VLSSILPPPKLCEDIDSWHLFDDRYLVYRKDHGSSSNSSRHGGGVLVAIKKCPSSRKLDVPGLVRSTKR